MQEQDSNILQGLKGSYKQRLEQEKKLYLQYNYFIEEGCKKYNLDYDNAFNAYSDAVISVIHNVISEKFNGNSSLKTYLFQIFSNKCIDVFRKSSTNKQKVHQTMEISDMLIQLPDAARNCIEKIMTTQTLNIVKTHLQNIGEKCKEILLLFEDGLTDNQIAIELNYKTTAVAKMSRLRCMEKLKEKVNEQLKKI